MAWKEVGAYSEQAVNELASVCRKMGFDPKREHIWHLIDTVHDREAKADEWQRIVKDLVTARDNFLKAIEGELEDLAAGAVPATATGVLGAVGQAWAANQLEVAWEAAEAAVAASG